MTDVELNIRLATDRDWPCIWRVFREVVATGDTYMYAPDVTEAAARASWMPDGSPRRITLIASLGLEVVATALIKPNAVGLGDHVANGAWMVSSRARGRGVGRALAVHAIDLARSMDFHAMQFNAVVASNANAIALWRSLGFEIVGTVPAAFRHSSLGLTPIHIMYRTL